MEIIAKETKNAIKENNAFGSHDFHIISCFIAFEGKENLITGINLFFVMQFRKDNFRNNHLFGFLCHVGLINIAIKVTALAI